MNNESTGSSPNWSHLAWAVGGLLAGTWLARKRIEDSKKSRAELDSPEDAEEAYEEIGDLLDKWEPNPECIIEDDFVNDLAAYLKSESDWETEVRPDTPAGVPDILVGDLIALEVKVNPKKTERDRSIGQCAGYSRLWITLMVIVDSSPSKIGRLREILADKGLDHIEVWDFA